MNVRLVFVNAPTQNGDFTLADKPGKAAGIRIAAALNAILGVGPIPHLWNTVMLAGDLRYRAAGPHRAGRAGFDAVMIRAKYGPGPEASILTDSDEYVAQFALAMVEEGLSSGALAIEPVMVRQCRGCGHMTGEGAHACRACGHADTREVTSRHLVADSDPRVPVLSVGDLHQHTPRVPPHLRAIAGNVPGRLLLSRTRDHGIDLGPVGLPGLVLDPRAGLHVTALAAAAGVETVAMAVTANGLANIAAYGRPFRHHAGTRLRYLLHGRIPYDGIAGFEPAYAARSMRQKDRMLFESWFLPLVSCKDKAGINPAQLPPLLKHFDRSCRSNAGSFHTLRARVVGGDPTWVMDRAALGAALATASGSR